MKYALINDTSAQGHYGCNGVVSFIEKIFDELGFVKIYTVSTNNYQQLEQSKKLDHSFLIVINAEGTLHNNNPFGLSIINLIPFFSNKGHKVFVVNGTYTDLDKEYIKKLKSAHYISSRDYTLSKELGFSFCLDFYFFFSKKKIQDIAKKEVKSTFWTDSIVPQISHYLLHYNNPFENVPIERLRFPINIRTLYRRFSSTKFFFTASNYYLLSEKIFLTYIKNSKYYTCGRYHGMVARIISGKDFTVYSSNTKKVENLLDFLSSESVLSFKRKIISHLGYEFFAYQIRNINLDKLSYIMEKNLLKLKEELRTDIQ